MFRVGGRMSRPPLPSNTPSPPPSPPQWAGRIFLWSYGPCESATPLYYHQRKIKRNKDANNNLKFLCEFVKKRRICLCQWSGDGLTEPPNFPAGWLRRCAPWMRPLRCQCRLLRPASKTENPPQPWGNYAQDCLKQWASFKNVAWCRFRFLRIYMNGCEYKYKLRTHQLGSLSAWSVSYFRSMWQGKARTILMYIYSLLMSCSAPVRNICYRFTAILAAWCGMACS